MVMEWVKSFVTARARRRKPVLVEDNIVDRNIVSPSSFGVALDELMSNAPKHAVVPPVVSRICEYLYTFGLDRVDLFHVNGSAKTIDRLYRQFELLGDANLEEINDVTAAAGVLMIFLRDLPGGLIPLRFTQYFFSVLKDSFSEEDVLDGIKNTLKLLPVENFAVLKYIVSFLAMLAEKEIENNMSAAVLAILFGPIVCRCEQSSAAGNLRDMECSKDVMHLFITEYNTLFLDEGDLSPRDFWARCVRKEPLAWKFPPRKVQSVPSFTSLYIENINPTLKPSASFLSLDHPVPAFHTLKNIFNNSSYSEWKGTQTGILSSHHSTPLFSSMVLSRALCHLDHERQAMNVQDRKELLQAKNMNKENRECCKDYDGDANNGSPKFKTKSIHVSDNRTLSVQSPGFQNSQEHLCSQQPLSSNRSSPLEHSSGNNIKLFIPALDLSTLHQHIDGADPIPMSLEESDSHMWLKTSRLTGHEDPDVAILSPRSHKMKKRNEASSNIDMPPSPPIQQDLYRKFNDDDCNYRLKQITMKIQKLKKKIKNYEESFEKDHGYKPSQGEKSAQSAIKKYLHELSKARKDLKCLKEETEKSSRSRHNSGASSSGAEISTSVTLSMAVTLDFILQSLKDKRQEAGRPEEVMLMSRDQLEEETIDLQEAIAHFEELHDRPKTCEERDIVRPLYDRYRSVKRMLIKPLSPCISLELQTVPEGRMMEIPQSVNRDSAQDGVSDPDFELDTEEGVIFKGLDFLNTEDKCLQQADKTFKNDRGSRSENTGCDSRLHEMSLQDLHAEIEVSKEQKKRLRKALREFESDFLRTNGRKVKKEDRYLLKSEYSDYKKVKARLRLLEALILKHYD